MPAGKVFRFVIFIAAAASVFCSGPIFAGCPSLLDHKFKTLQGAAGNLCEFQGKVVLVVNTASYCGFTPQYQALESLYQKYQARGLTVLGFPSNNFGSQEPGSNQEVADFCERTYRVRFPMFEKSNVVGANINPLYEQLAKTSSQRPQWNFHKYLIARDGKSVLGFPSDMTPDSPEFVHEVERLLALPGAQPENKS
jgi:glutathione peroxidase